MTLNHSKLLYSYCAFPFWYGMQGRYATVLIDLLSLFQYFILINFDQLWFLL